MTDKQSRREGQGIPERSGRSGIEITRSYSPNHGAMLQALRVVLGLPKVPICLEERKTPAGPSANVAWPMETT